ncbi:MAG: hypothetical protein QXL15_03870, partial [Candidatus Korarchaeota archaeon]
EDMGKITQTLGDDFEEKAYERLPKVLEKKHGIKIERKHIRKTIRTIGGEEEINFIGISDSGRVIVVGEASEEYRDFRDYKVIMVLICRRMKSNLRKECDENGIIGMTIGEIIKFI